MRLTSVLPFRSDFHARLAISKFLVVETIQIMIESAIQASLEKNTFHRRPFPTQRFSFLVSWHSGDKTLRRQTRNSQNTQESATFSTKTPKTRRSQHTFNQNNQNTQESAQASTKTPKTRKSEHRFQPKHPKHARVNQKTTSFSRKQPKHARVKHISHF